jgi:C_GCAxxG_C_C family probable redox protein
MWEAYELGNEDFLWAGITFFGGISRDQEAPCGAVTGGAVALGLRYRCALADKEKAKQARNDAREDAGQLVRDFKKQFGGMSCGTLLGIDFSEPGGYQRFQESGVWKDKCYKYIEYVVEKLYELDNGKGKDKAAV